MLLQKWPSPFHCCPVNGLSPLVMGRFTFFESLGGRLISSVLFLLPRYPELLLREGTREWGIEKPEEDFFQEFLSLTGYLGKPATVLGCMVVARRNQTHIQISSAPETYSLVGRKDI